MPDLDSYFKIDKGERDSHPLIRLLDVHQGRPGFGAAKVQIIRPRAALGFEPARLSLQFFNKQDQLYDYRTELWDAALNDALVDRMIRAIDEPNEIQRFGLGLGAAGVKAPTGAVSFGPYNTSFNRTFTGTGSTSQAGSVTAYMTATVVSVLPNGNLVIRGTRWTKVNDELQQIVLEGVVRPVDISNTNTVLSQDVAEAKIFMLGKGPVAQYQKPGWLEQIWNVISPF